MFLYRLSQTNILKHDECKRGSIKEEIRHYLRENSQFWKNRWKRKEIDKLFGQFYVVSKFSNFIARVDPYFWNIKDTHVNYGNKESCTVKGHLHDTKRFYRTINAYTWRRFRDFVMSEISIRNWIWLIWCWYQTN